MSKLYILSNKATKDIADILEYSYENFDYSQALKYKNSLENCFNLLADNPKMGRKCNSIRANYFRHEHQSHTIFYTLKSDKIFIAAIIHKKMALHQLFDNTEN